MGEEFSIIDLIRVDKFFDDVKELSQNSKIINDLDFSFTIDNVIFIFQKNHRKYENINSVYLRTIVSNEKRKGNASRALKKILKIADINKIYITTLIKPGRYESSNISIEAMSNWFINEGFIRQYIAEYQTEWTYVPKELNITPKFNFENKYENILEYINIEFIINKLLSTKFAKNRKEYLNKIRELNKIDNFLLEIGFDLINRRIYINDENIILYCLKNGYTKVPCIVNNIIKNDDYENSFYLDSQLLKDDFSHYIGFTRFSNVFIDSERSLSPDSSNVSIEKTMKEIVFNVKYENKNLIDEYIEFLKISSLKYLVKKEFKYFYNKFKDIHILSVFYAFIIFFKSYRGLFDATSTYDIILDGLVCFVVLFICARIIFYSVINTSLNTLNNERYIKLKIFDYELSLNWKIYFRLGYVSIIYAISGLLLYQFYLNNKISFMHLEFLYSFNDYIYYIVKFFAIFELVIISCILFCSISLKFIDDVILNAYYLTFGENKKVSLRKIIMKDFEEVIRNDRILNDENMKSITKRMKLLV